MNQDPNTGANYNTILGGHQFMLQPTWLQPYATPHCALNATSLAPTSSPASGSISNAVTFSLSTMSLGEFIGVCVAIAVGGVAVLVLLSFFCFRSRMCMGTNYKQVELNQVDSKVSFRYLYLTTFYQNCSNLTQIIWVFNRRRRTRNRLYKLYIFQKDLKSIT